LFGVNDVIIQKTILADHLSLLSNWKRKMERYPIDRGMITNISRKAGYPSGSIVSRLAFCECSHNCMFFFLWKSTWCVYKEKNELSIIWPLLLALLMTASTEKAGFLVKTGF